MPIPKINPANVQLLLLSARGRYIPQHFVTLLDLSVYQGIDPADVEICKDPEHELYWEAWDSILDKATYTADDGRVFRLHQDGDLWLLCYESMTAEECKNFGFYD